ncbi:Integrase [Pseudomonas sp. NFACC23-1]|uniref:tyrosine-type recombinase/integrase n=1 Tax=unclassified Pseudomonas TaxID=196821 RepID=UPI000883397B|nr:MULTISPECIES: tyrosine-type recombinase/integrase [unclassified Pseudomonas]SDB28793.1 Integrase [Pseudomonas sp. NFACC17-2]SEJ42274.1 Integrase [Pseudomonas sp. NFACC23-1]SFW67184.1 Integrase [Pseudomonas sp. NFACC16-2]
MSNHNNTSPGREKHQVAEEFQAVKDQLAIDEPNATDEAKAPTSVAEVEQDDRADRSAIDDNDDKDDRDDNELTDEERLLQDLEEDGAESEIEEVEALNEEFEAEVAEPSVTLVKKLELTNGDFPVGERSGYNDVTWYLKHGKHAFPNNVHFDRTLEGSNTLKRALIYHVIPEFSPFSYIRAYSTTKAWGNEYKLLEQHIFEPNKLTAKPEHIRMISVPMLLKAFEDAANTGLKHQLFTLFKLVKFWISLSEHKLIPQELRLDIRLEDIDTPERRREAVRLRFQGSLEGWVSFSEEDLEVLMDYSMFWLEGVMPKLKALKDYLVETKVAFLSDQMLTRTTRQHDLEALMTITVDGKEVMRPRFREHFKYDALNYSYTWIEPYADVLDGIRNAMFIMIALITGARKSELAVMNFSDLTQDENGEYWLRIVRWKTAKSPTHGEVDRLPIPKFLGDMIREYENVRSIKPFIKQGWLFQAQKSNKQVKKATPALINYVIISLKNELPIERLHCHRFRKTIAEILINRDERNIDIIRALFGHKSFAMTLRYIARNPLMVRTVAIAIEQSYTREFQEIVAGIRLGAHSGDAARRIYSQIFKRPDEFAGKQLKVTLLSYVTHLLAAGEPIFVRRTAVGTFCMSGEHFTRDTLPPCLKGRELNLSGDLIMPDPNNCQLECRKIIVLQTARQSLKDNETFYVSVLEKAKGKLSAKAEYELQRRIAAIRVHLNNLETSGHSASQMIEVQHV